ncbi:MAG: hypothetical protein C5B48_04255 [Candidatus Rokuibacteriota bacterium]|nr:MAG: hypothetical protein C5B48_04255 [Candidatus Rokubacteria bacterium]
MLETAMETYLSVCAIYQDEAPYLREWVAFHRLMGVERFFLYDHESTDGHRAELAPYLDDGTVLIHDWPVNPGQKEAYDHCVAEHGQESRWIAFIDIDEFLFTPGDERIAEVLGDYEHLPGVGVPWAVFGSSGHKTTPPGLVVESYTLRSARPRKWGWFKSIVDPRTVVRAMGPHSFSYRDRNFAGPVPEFVPFERLRINHYWTKSEEELRQKLSRPRADTGAAYAPTPERALAQTSAEHSVHDDAIMRYLPALREELAATSGSAA